MAINSTAVVFESPGELSLREVELPECGPRDCLVEVHWSGISTGTERLLWNGQMPKFPGLAYPLVPGYESAGVVIAAGEESVIAEGSRVFVPGSRGFTNVHGLFGGAAKHLIVDSSRLVAVDDNIHEEAVLLALIATAVHAVERFEEGPPQLVVGHGVLGRLIARLAVMRGAADLTVLEQDPARRSGATDYQVIDPAALGDMRFDRVCDVSGDAQILNTLLPALKPRGTVVLAGFYHHAVSFDFPPAFMNEASILIAAQWQARDLSVATELLNSGQLAVSDLITHRSAATDAGPAYETAFTDADCLKLVLDWRAL